MSLAQNQKQPLAANFFFTSAEPDRIVKGSESAVTGLVACQNVGLPLRNLGNALHPGELDLDRVCGKDIEKTAKTNEKKNLLLN